MGPLRDGHDDAARYNVVECKTHIPLAQEHCVDGVAFIADHAGQTLFNGWLVFVEAREGVDEHANGPRVAFSALQGKLAQLYEKRGKTH